MQIIEILIFILAIFTLVYIIKSKKQNKKFMAALLVADLIFLVIHLLIGSIRWQLYPLYIAIILCFSMGIIYIFRFNQFRGKKVIRRIDLSITLVLILISVISVIILPVNEMPTPSGDYQIGTSSFVLTDENRVENYGDDQNRRIKIQVWYPAETIDGYEAVPWLQDGKPVSTGLSNSMGLPSFILDHTSLITSNSYKDAPISTDKESYPLVILSHGWSSLRNLHTDMAEELTSLGYIVVGIEHTYGSLATVFDEDDVDYINYDALPNTDTQEEFDVYSNTLVNTYAGDVSFTLDELEKMNLDQPSSLLFSKLDLDNIGLLGHSTGGGADVAVALNDQRIKALVGLDAWVEPIYSSEIEKGLDIPTLFLRSEQWEDSNNNDNLYSLVDNNNSLSLLYQIDGTIHTDFSMTYMFSSPISKIVNINGDVAPEKLTSILKTMVTTFFDSNLKGESSTDLNNMDLLFDEVRKIK